MTITRINEFNAAEGKSDDMYNFLKSLISYISSSAGCMSCEVLRRQDDHSICLVIEKWQSVEAHKDSIANFPKEDMQNAMSLFAKAPNGYYCQ